MAGLVLMNHKTNRKFHKADFILLAVLLAAGLLIMLLVFLFSKPGQFVQIRVSGEVIMTVPLDVDDEVLIEGVNGGHNTLVIKDNKAYMENASCPDKLCENMGKISSKGQSIVCLPNQVVAEIISEEKEAVDAVVK